MSEFSESDYSGLKFNIFKHSPLEGDYLKIFPDLNLYKEFSKPLLEGIDRNQLIAWIICVYDKESPFRKKYADLPIRKYHAALEVGFELNSKGKFENYIEEIFDPSPGFMNEVAVDMITAYCKLHYSTKYSFVVMMEALFYTNLKTAVAGLGTNKMSELKSIEETLDNAQRELLAFDSNKEIVKSLYKRINSDRIELAPEDISRKLKEDKTVAEILDED